MRWILWLIWISLIVGLATMPWKNYVGHSHWDQVRWIPFSDHPFALSDILANVALFVPFGYILGQALHGWHPKKVWIYTLMLSTTLSIAVEFFQIYCHNRTPSTTDIFSNLLGAMVGAVLSTSR